MPFSWSGSPMGNHRSKAEVADRHTRAAENAVLHRIPFVVIVWMCPTPGEETLPKQTPRDEAEPKLLAGRQNLRLRVPSPQGVLALHAALAGRGVRPADRGRGGFGEVRSTRGGVRKLRHPQQDPRFTTEAQRANQPLIDLLNEIASRKQATPAQTGGAPGIGIGHFQRNSTASSCFSVSRMASRTPMSTAEISKSSSAFCWMCGVLVALGSTTAPFCSGSGCTVVVR